MDGKQCSKKIRSGKFVSATEMCSSKCFSGTNSSLRSQPKSYFVYLGCQYCLLASGILLIISGLFFNFFWTDVLEHTVKKELSLTESSRSYKMWIENPIPLYINFYFFNWTNPGDMKQPGYKPKFQEKGPYRFREFIKKVDIKWNQNGTVTYRKLRTWVFEPEGSKGSLEDNITTLNVIALTAARHTKYWNRIARLPLSITLTTTQKMNITKKVRELLFDGYSDPLIEFASNVPGLSSKVPFDRFGWFYKRNGTLDFDGVFNMETGSNGFDVFGKVRFWNYSNRTLYYNEKCGEVRGSAGDFWPPERSTKKNIALYSPDMCRYIEFNYNREEPLGDIKGYRYDSGSQLFDNGTMDPSNECFCNGLCSPMGTLNVSSCRSGAPAFVSYPHFHLADSFYTNSVDGMNPDSRKHDMYIILEQTWGIPLEVAIRLQINILVEPDPTIRLYKDIPRIYFPMVWFEQKVTMPEDMRSEIIFLTELPRLGWIASVIFHSLGCFCIATYIFLTTCNKKWRKNT